MEMSSILRGFCTVVLSTKNISPLCLLAQLIVVLIQLTIPILVYGMSSILRGFCTVVLSTRNNSPLCLLAQLTVDFIQLTIPILIYGNV